MCAVAVVMNILWSHTFTLPLSLVSLPISLYVFVGICMHVITIFGEILLCEGLKSRDQVE